MVYSFLILSVTTEEKIFVPIESREKEKSEEGEAPVCTRTRHAARRRQSAPVSPAREIARPENEDRDWHFHLEEPDIPGPHIEERGRQRVTLVNLLAPSRSRLAVTGRVDGGLVAALTDAPGFAGLQARALLGNFETRAHIPLLKPEELQLLGEDRLLNCRGDTRWKDLQSVWKSYLVWAKVWQDLYESQQLAPTFMVMNFLETKMAVVNPQTGRKLAKTSAHRYLKDLRQLHKSQDPPIELDNQTLDAYSAGLDRDGGRAPLHQAHPATRADVEATRQFLTPSEYVGMELARKTASRIGEIAALTATHVSSVEGTDGVWQVTFPYHKGDPFRLGTSITFYPSEGLRRSLEQLKTEHPSTPLSDLTTARASATLGRVSPGLTAHSVKRGALVDLLNAGVPLSLIQVIAKHKDLETLLIYLPKVSVAMALGLHEATRSL